jgi:plasmid stability protein
VYGYVTDGSRRKSHFFSVQKNGSTFVHILNFMSKSRFDIDPKLCHYCRSQTIHVIHMTELRIRKLDNWVASWLKQQAKLHKRSLEKELRELLTQTALSQKQQIADQLMSDLESLERKHGLFPEGATGIREERDRRG